MLFGLASDVMGDPELNNIKFIPRNCSGLSDAVFFLTHPILLEIWGNSPSPVGHVMKISLSRVG